MPKEPLEHQDIIELLAKLKAETPDYPADLVEARKAAYLKQIVEIEISRNDRRGEGGNRGGTGGAGGSGAALGGGVAQGMSLKAVFAVGLAVAMLTAAYLFRDQIVDFLAENEIINVEETATPSIAPAPAGLATEIPTLSGSSTGVEATENAPGFENNNLGETPDNANANPDHGFSQTPGTPTPQVRGSPFNVFQYLICILQHDAKSCQ
jgi:hypothetical protein